MDVKRVRSAAITVRRARDLRKHLSLPEHVLWERVRGNRLAGLRFRRQHPMGQYILDFYCAAARLAVEIDGSGHGHPEQSAHDRVRDRWLDAHGIVVLRFSASAILDEIARHGVLQKITEAAIAHGAIPHPPAEAGEGDREAVEGAAARTMPERHSRPNAKRCAVFDLDGALIDSVPHFAAILNTMLSDRGAPFRVTEMETRPHATAGGLAMVSGLLRGVCGEPEAAIAEFREHYALLATPPDCLFPGVRDALMELKADGIALALWSNKAQHLCEKVLLDLGLAPLFDCIVGTREGVPLKPDPTGFDLAVLACGSNRASACFVGDSEADYEGARTAGVPFILLTHGYGDYARDYTDAALASGFAEVPELVRATLGITA